MKTSEDMNKNKPFHSIKSQKYLPKFFEQNESQYIIKEKSFQESFQYLFSNPFPNYTFKSFMGKGSFGTCFLVHSHVYNEDFVAKVIKRNNNEKAANHPEIRHLILIDSQYIIRAYDYFKDDKFLFFILEYCPLGPITNILKNSSNDVLLRLFYQILQGVDAIHKKNIAHLDIKPSNILCDQYGRPKIIDFGISVSNINETKLQSGTAPYQAPEQILSMIHDPFKADIWSLGVTFYYLAFKSLPWPNLNLDKMAIFIEYGVFEIPKNTYPPIETLIRSMIVIEPSRRPDCQTLLSYDFFQSFKDKPDLPFYFTHPPRKPLLKSNKPLSLIHSGRVSSVDNYVYV
jgi:serine/threonine protein kinase